MEGFRRWALSNEVPDKMPVMFLRGEVYIDMGKEEIRAHAAVKTEIAGVMYNLNAKEDFGEIYINGVLVTNVSAQVSTNPDFVGIFWESLESGKVRYVTNKKGQEMEIEGSPDWVMEIISESSVFKDKQKLRKAYHEAGIREYWLVDARGSEIEFQILEWHESGFVPVTAKKGWLASMQFRHQFKLTRRRNRRGAWKYRLAIKGMSR
ncbi:MAG: Uma2 family endonuclease [Planctomycetes bacterium]|nr:Uma2 family endonuclease [Planctomycetota bacterium]